MFPAGAFALWAILNTSVLAADFRGQPLGQVILEIGNANGLSILYSSELIPDYVLITAATPDAEPLQLVGALLAPYGLELEPGSGGQWLVKRTPQKPLDAVEISGQVVDQSGSPIPKATVRLAPGDHQAATDEQGRYRFTGVPPYTASLMVRAPGYNLVRRTVASAEVKRGDLEPIILALSDGALAPITIIASHYGLMRSDPLPHQYLSRDDIDRLPHIADDIFRAARWLPGMASADIGARLNVRGGLDNELLVMLDGMRIYEPYHLRDLLALFSIVDSNTIDGVDLYSGAFPARYGGVSSAVLDVQSRSPDPQYAHQLGVSFTNAFAQTSGELAQGDGYWLASARTGYLDVVLDFVDPQSGLDPAYFDMLGKVSTPLGNRTQLSANLLLAGDNSLVETDGNDFSDGDFRDAYLWLNADTELAPGLTVVNRLFGGYLSLDKTAGIDDGARLQARMQDNRHFGFAGLGSDWSWAGDGEWSWNAGLEVRSFRARYRYLGSALINDLVFFNQRPLPELRTSDVDLRVEGSAYAAYGLARRHFSSSLALELGLRWDKQTYVGDVDNSQLSPRANLLWQLGEQTRLRLAWGIFHQPTEPNQLAVGDGETHFSPAQRARQSVLALEHRTAANVQWRLELYDKQYSSVRPYWENLFFTTDVLLELESDRVMVSPERARARGGELSVRQTRASGLSWWGSYVYARAEDRLAGRWVPRSWDQRHAVSLGLNVPLRNWDFTLAWRYHSGWPQTEFGSAPALVGNVPAVLPSLESRNGGRTGIYHRLDMRVSREVPVPRGRLRLYLEFLNVFNRRNECCVEFDVFLTRSQEIRFNTSQDDWLPFVPSLGVKWEF